MTSWEYAAGLYEGEGSIGCYSSGVGAIRRQLRVSIRMTDREPLERMLELGIGRLNGPTTNGWKPHHQPIYQWAIWTAAECRAFMGSIGHLLSPRRQEQARAAFETYEAFQVANGLLIDPIGVRGVSARQPVKN